MSKPTSSGISHTCTQPIHCFCNKFVTKEILKMYMYYIWIYRLLQLPFILMELRFQSMNRHCNNPVWISMYILTSTLNNTYSLVLLFHSILVISCTYTCWLPFFLKYMYKYVLIYINIYINKWAKIKKDFLYYRYLFISACKS